MDLGLREDDTRTSSFFVSTNSGESYFTEQALRAGFIANDLRRSELMMNSDPLRDAIQRELEKERIREEIIASEIFRKRELESEVRRELAMERDLVLRRAEGFSLVATSSSPSMWSEPRVSMLHRPNGFGVGERLALSAKTEVETFDRLPFQRHPEAVKMAEGSKGPAGKIMVLPKPIKPILAGTKRKVGATGGASDLNISNSKKKPQEWSCALCQVSATCEQGLNEHFQGKKHKAKEANLRENRTAGKNTSNLSPLPKKADKLKFIKKNVSPNPKSDKKPELQSKKNLKPVEVKKKRFSFWCEDCQVGCHSETVMNNHCKGRKHIARVQAQKQNGDAASITSHTTTPIDVTSEKDKDASEEANEEAMEDNDRDAGGVEEVEAEGEEEAAKTMESVVDEVAEEEA